MLTIAELASETPQKEGAVVNNAMRGVMVQNITPEIRKTTKSAREDQGVVISGIGEWKSAETKLIPVMLSLK